MYAVQWSTNAFDALLGLLSTGDGIREILEGIEEINQLLASEPERAGSITKD